MDPVNQPAHYKAEVDNKLATVRVALLEDMEMNLGNLECFEAMVNHLSTLDEIRGYLRGNSFKYRWRYRSKAGLQDLRKAGWYENKLLILEQTLSEMPHV